MGIYFGEGQKESPKKRKGELIKQRVKKKKKERRKEGKRRKIRKRVALTDMIQRLAPLY